MSVILISFGYNLEFIKDFHGNKNYLYIYVCMFVFMDVHFGGIFSSNSNFQVFLRVQIPDIIFFSSMRVRLTLG